VPVLLVKGTKELTASADQVQHQKAAAAAGLVARQYLQMAGQELDLT
jgi:hypothetical protein